MTKKSALISLLADRPVAYHPDLARILGGVKQAIFVSQLLYWTDKGSRADGFIWKTQEEWTDETGLSAGEQRTARKHLVEQGILIERLQDIPARLYYKLNLDTLQARMEEYYEQDMTIPHNLESETPPAIPEITTEITTEEKPADADFWGPSGKPDGKPITTNLPASATDPLDLAAKTQAARAKEKQWTVTIQAGGDDPWADKPLKGFCALAGRTTLTSAEEKNWPRELENWASGWHATPDETYAAIKAIPDSEDNWKTFKSPFSSTFKDLLNAMIDRIRNGQPLNVKGNGSEPKGQLSQEQQSDISKVIAQKNLETAQRFGFAHLLTGAGGE